MQLNKEACDERDNLMSKLMTDEMKIQLLIMSVSFPTITFIHQLPNIKVLKVGCYENRLIKIIDILGKSMVGGVH